MHTYIYIHIHTHTYIYAVKLLYGPSLAVLDIIIWAKWTLLLGQVCFEPIFIVALRICCTLNYQFVFWEGDQLSGNVIIVFGVQTCVVILISLF